MILFFLGPSASGKDYFRGWLIKNYSFLSEIVLHTTRPMRLGEIDGVSYNFVTMEEMDRLEKENLLIERRDYNTISGVWSYATSASAIDSNKIHLVTGTPKMLESFINYYGNDMPITIFYIHVDNTVRLTRAMNRAENSGESIDEVKRRYLSDMDDFSLENLEKFKPLYIINNNKSTDYTKSQLAYFMEAHIIESFYDFPGQQYTKKR